MNKENTIINNTTTIGGSQYINYQGNISVSIVKNNKVLQTKKFHNSGMPKLFEFLAKALGGNTSEYLRPVKIKLFRYPGADTTGGLTPTNFNWEVAWNEGEQSPTAVSPYIWYNATPVIKKTAKTNTSGISATTYAEDYQYEVTFHFTVPAAYISEDTIHIVGFYPNSATNDIEDVSAYYLFTKDDGKLWDPIAISKISGNFSIFIDWTLIISNK